MTTSTIQTNEFNDLFLADGQNLVVISGIPACSQNINQATLMRASEDIYNTLNGVLYFECIFSPQPNPDGARESIANNILACPDVIGIDSLSISISANSFNYAAIVDTIYGPISVSST